MKTCRLLRQWAALPPVLSTLLRLAVALGIVQGAVAQESLSDILGSGPFNLANPVERQQVVERARASWDLRSQSARTKALRFGYPERRVLPNGRVIQLFDFSGNQPKYFTTHNLNAAISTGAFSLQQPPLSLTGAGVTVGEWDGGAVRSSHQEFGARVSVKDGAAPLDHSTHVGGTIAAAGVNASAKGMAPAVQIDSYEWTSDKSEMTSRGASYPGESGKIYLSNHSYGFVNGWNYTGQASPKWDWWGTGTTTTGVDQDFGKYDTNARDTDALEASLPYYLIVRSAGNDRVDNPATGDPVALSGNGTTVISYDPTVHPAGDGVYKATGYDTISGDAIAKNVLTIGAVADAVLNGVRQPLNGTMTSFSSWGPTDDGRIKPDLVANGDNLFSTVASSDTAYGYMSGTSMASPNATGSAALLIQRWGQLFPGHAVRASTLKALLIETADDLGNPGPDYQFGWGLINVKAAADLEQACKDVPAARHIIEDEVTTSLTTRTYTFTWDGVSPILATLCWTDPAGTATTSSDSRTARLVNNLDLKINAPGGTTFQPWIMPYVGTWTNANLTAPATTGLNNTDTVEQVLISSPPAAGVYTAVVSFSGTLTNSSQTFSLVVNGAAAGLSASAPSAVGITPATGTGGVMTVTVTGTGFLPGANVSLTKSGQATVAASGQEVFPEKIRCRLNTNGMAAGSWNVVVTNPDGQTVTLPAAFTITSALWQDDFEGGATGWSHSASVGTISTWALTTTSYNSPTHSFYASAPASKNVDDLYSPAVAIPSNASNLRLSFWHRYSLQSSRDAGVLEFSLDDGTTWFDVTASGSGASFATGGYNATVSTSGSTSTRNPLAGQRAWSGTQSTFGQVAIDLTDTVKYAGKNLRIRWRLATDASTASTGWYIDDISLSGVAITANLPPTVTAQASALPAQVSGTATQLSVAADDDTGEPSLTYTWSVIGGPFDRPVQLSDNGTNSAKNVTATFASAGTYTFTVTVRDSGGLTASSNVGVVVGQTLASITVTPSNPIIVYGTRQAFSAIARDQFNDALTAQPAFLWSATAGGAIDSSGVFTPNLAGGPYTITAISAGISGNAQISVSKAVASVTIGGIARTYDGSETPVTATTDPTGLTVAFTYDGSATPPRDAGSYSVVGTIVDANFTGENTATLVIAPASATVTLSNLHQTYDGTGKTIGVATTPSGLSTSILFNDQASLPVKAGDYQVDVAIADKNYVGSGSGLLHIAKASASVVLGDLKRTYDAKPKSVSVSTDPAGLANKVTYDGSPMAPTGSGSYAVNVTVEDENYQGVAIDTLTIAKAGAALVLADLDQTYDGQPKPASATTVPSGLAVSLSYDGTSNVPTSAGSYSVIATVTDPNYVAVASGALVVKKAAATISLSHLAQNYDGTVRIVAASTLPEGLVTSLTYDGKATPPTFVGSYAVSAVVTDSNYSGEATGTLVVDGQTLNSWIAQHFTPAEILAGLAAEIADPDGDGLSNLAEYALGTDPHALTLDPKVSLGPDGLTLEFTRPKSLPGVSYIVESCDDAANWHPLPLQILYETDFIEEVRAVDPLTAGDQSRRMIRLRIVH